jgi:hypothetical protein
VLEHAPAIVVGVLVQQSENPHAVAGLADDQAVPIVLDLIDPSGPHGGRLAAVGRQGAMKPGQYQRGWSVCHNIAGDIAEATYQAESFFTDLIDPSGPHGGRLAAVGRQGAMKPGEYQRGWSVCHNIAGDIAEATYQAESFFTSDARRPRL